MQVLEGVLCPIWGVAQSLGSAAFHPRSKWKSFQPYEKFLLQLRLSEVIFEGDEVISNTSQCFTRGGWGGWVTSKHLEKSQSGKPRVASAVRGMSKLILARTGAVSAEPSAMGSFSGGRHLMDILRIPGDY